MPNYNGRTSSKIHVSDFQSDVYELNENQFQTMDIICGRMCPELGGSEEFLDILEFNLLLELPVGSEWRTFRLAR